MSDTKQPSHNALQQKVGDVYHYYVAIKYMFDNNEWVKCTIEESGDITLFDKNDEQLFNIEVKHHLEAKELKIYEEEFQKTLYNWFNIDKEFSNKTQLILFTTSNIPDNNILKQWNEFDVDKKYKELNGNSKKTDKSYYSKVEKYFLPISKDIERLKKVLKKFLILESSSNINSIKEDIQDNTFFNIFKLDEHKNEVINSLYGMIGNGLTSVTTWEINKSMFDQKLKELTILAQDTILRTNDDIKTDVTFEKYKGKLFINKLTNIEFDEDVLTLAIDDYAKTIIEASKRLELTNSIEYHSRLEEYERSLIKRINETKTAHKYQADDDIKKSQQSYFQVMGSSKIPFMPQEFDDQTTFFQKGYFHVLADDEKKPKQICWSLKPEDLL